MIRRALKIGRWYVEFYFCPDGYDEDELIDRLYDFGAGPDDMRTAIQVIESGKPNTGLFFPNAVEHLALLAVGPTTGPEEFQDTLVHEIHHLAVAIASELGIDLEDEGPAYLAGDSARALADIVCRLGCTRCKC